MVAATLVLTLDWSCRCFRFPSCRRLLCPMGEVCEGTGVKPPHGVCHRVLWVDRHHRERGPTTPKHRPGTHPAVHNTLQNLVISLCVSMGAIVHSQSGVSIQLSPTLQYTTRGIAWFMILQFQATMGDVIIVLPPLKFHTIICDH